MIFETITKSFVFIEKHFLIKELLHGIIRALATRLQAITKQLICR